MTLLLLLALAALAPDAMAQDDSTWFDAGHLRYTDWTYDPAIRSVKFHKSGNELSWPVITLGSGETLELSFDDLGDGYRDFWYTFIHCDALWFPSDLNVMDYIQGFPESPIDDHQPSLNTLQAYYHHQVTLFDNGVDIMLSGNYLLKVFLKDQPDRPVITRRFMVVEEKVGITGDVRFATDIDQRNYFQEVRFSIDRSSLYVSDPYRDIRVVVRQNGHWATALTGLKPRMVRGDILDYEYDRGNYFSGGNEFRHFSTKSLKYYSENVERITSDRREYQVWLYPDPLRRFLVYHSMQDINGRCLLTSEDVNYPQTESEYTWVHFTLPYEAPLFHGDIYVFGELTGWQYIPEARMQYDFELKAYTCALYLKQGYYDYQYMFLENGKESADVAFIEGQHAETENEYYILVYFQGPGDRYQRLVGYKAMSSGD